MLDATGRTHPLQGARLLVLAVLQEAIGTFQRHADARDRRGRSVFREVEAWFASDETAGIFSFVSVCDALGIDPTFVRAGLQRWIHRHRAAFAAGTPWISASGNSAGERTDMRRSRPGLVPSLRPGAAPVRNHGWPVASGACRGSGGDD